MEKEITYYNKKIKPIFSELITAYLNFLNKNQTKTEENEKTDKNKSQSQIKPEVSFLINFLINKGNYHSLYTPLSNSEREELILLREKYLFYLKKDLSLSSKPILSSRKRKGISSEAYGKFNPYSGLNSLEYPKSVDQIKKLYDQIKNFVFFCELSYKNMKLVIESMKEKKVFKNEVVIREGEDGDKMYFVEYGQLRCIKNNKIIKYYSNGNSFGELALLYNSPRGATIIADEECVLWELDREVFKYLIRFQNEERQMKYYKFLKSIDLFSSLSEFQIRQISEAIKEKKLSNESVIIRAGDSGNEFYIIETGCAYATIINSEGIHEKVKYYQPGDYFGELALIRQAPRACNIFSETDIVLLVLDRSSFKRLLGPLEDIFKKNMDIYKKFGYLFNKN